MAQAHRDSQNSHLPNVVVPLSSFEGGEIVVNTGKQEVSLDVAQGPVSFCAREHVHHVAPFKGRRVILVLFSLKGCLHLSAEDRDCLLRLGFPLPTKEALAATTVAMPQVLKQQPDPPPVLGCNSLKHQGPSMGEEPKTKLPRLVPRPSRQAPLLVEICAGSAILSRTALDSGWDVVPVDQASCRFTPQTPLVVLDLREPEALDLLLEFDAGSPADWFHLGLPCGTCSRARERPLPGNQGARPLRGPDHLFGFPHLRPSEAEQVAASNAVYRACIRILFRAFQTGALVTIENPVRSWLWPLLAVLVKAHGSKAFADWFFQLQDYDFDACVFGSRRAKATRIKGSPSVFEGLSLSCDQSHIHLSWQPVRLAGRWMYPTKQEAEYAPELCSFLCQKASQAIASSAVSRPASMRAKVLRAAVRASAAQQTRAMPALIPEFSMTMPLASVPPGRDVKMLGSADSSVAGGKSDSSASPVVGVYHTMEEHLERALDLPCPGDAALRLPDPLRKNLFLILTKGPVAVSKMRLEALKQVNELAAALAGDEKALRATMHEDVDKVTRGKAICLFRALLEETDFPDMGVVDLLVHGVPLVGAEQPSPLFAKRHKPALLSPEQLEAQCILRRSALKATRSQVSAEDLRDLETETAAEVQSGFLVGPFCTEQEVSDRVGSPCWSLSPRFILRQGEDAKIRIIDDLKASAVNQSFSSSSYLDLQDTDYSVGLLRFISRALQGDGVVEVPLQDGSVLRGALSAELRHRPPLLGKTLDLSKAYRQVGICPKSRRHAVLGFPDGGGVWQHYIALSLPFGASASVFGFNKIALAILHILVVKFLALATDFYDDYTLFEFQPGASLLDKISMRLLSLLGWAFAKEGKKFVPFSPCVVSLGVSLDLTRVWDGQIVVSNKPGRLARIAELLKPIAEGSEVSKAQLASLHGLINFAGGYVMGFELKPTARMLSKALTGPFMGNTDALRRACALALDVIGMCKPRVCLATTRKPIILYTDGAFDDDIGSWGSLVVDPESGVRWLFGGQVPQMLIERWHELAGEQVICEIEAYALAITVFGLRGFLGHRSVIAFVDNEPCRLGLIKRYSPSLPMMGLISLVSLLEGSLCTSMWYERVPSKHLHLHPTRWSYTAWDQEKQQSLPTEAPPLANQEIVAALKILKAAALTDGVIHRFSPLHKLTDSPQSKVVVFQLVLTTRPTAEKVHAEMSKLTNLAVTSLVGMRIRPERLQISPLAKQMMQRSTGV